MHTKRTADTQATIKLNVFSYNQTIAKFAATRRSARHRRCAIYGHFHHHHPLLRQEAAPLKLRPYDAIQICLFLL